MTRRRQRPSTSSLPTAAFSLLSTALCLTLVEVPRAVHAWVIPKSIGNVLLPSSPRGSNGQQQDGLLSPLHISTAESLIIGTPTSPAGSRDGPSAGTAIDPSFSADATTATTSVPLSKRLQQIETPLDQWLQDVMEMTTATLAGLTATSEKEKDIATAQTSAAAAVKMLSQPIPSGQNQIPVIDRMAKVRRKYHMLRF